MKFGNYNLATAAERQENDLFSSRLKKVRNTSSYLVGKFNSQINTIRKTNTSAVAKRKIKLPTESPLSYRASLFDEQKHLPQTSEKCRELREKLERSRTDDSVYESCGGGGSQKYSPSDFHRIDDEGEALSERCVFDKVKFSKINNAITGKRQHKMLKNVYFTIKSNKCANISNLYESMDFVEARRDSMRKCYKHSPPVDVDEPKIRMDLNTLLKATQYDEKAELEILKNYFDSMSYSEICKDQDFKQYLKKKNYQDAIDYIYSGTSFMGSSLRGDKSSIYGAATDVLKRYYDLDLEIVKESNDCDSLKKEKVVGKQPPSVDRRKYYNRENSQFFCKSNKMFDDYYKRNTNIFYEATKTVDDNFFQKDFNEMCRTYERARRMFAEGNVNSDESLIDELYGHKSQPFVYCTMPTRKLSRDFSDKLGSGNQKISFDPDMNSDDAHDINSEFNKYQTYPQKKRPKKSYEELLRYCENSLAHYATIDIKMEKWQKLSRKEFSEKTYNKIIKAFVRLRGFETVDAYVQYHYGRMLDKSFDTHLKMKLRETLSSHDEQLVISKPILKTTTQSSVAANHRLESIPPPYTSGSYGNETNNYFYKRQQTTKAKTHGDYFKHYDYIESHYEKPPPPPMSSMDANQPDKRTLFRFVEDMHENGIDFDEIIGGGHSQSCENLKSEIHRHNRINDRVSKFDRKLSELGKRSVDNIYESIRGEANAKRGLHKHHNHKCVERRRGREKAQQVNCAFTFNSSLFLYRKLFLSPFNFRNAH